MLLENFYNFRNDIRLLHFKGNVLSHRHIAQYDPLILKSWSSIELGISCAIDACCAIDFVV